MIDGGRGEARKLQRGMFLWVTERGQDVTAGGNALWMEAIVKDEALNFQRWDALFVQKKKGW